MIAIVDYGMGNLRSMQKAFERVGATAIITSKASDLDTANKLVVPGVGAFQDAMYELEKRELITAIINNINAGKLFLGVCLGLQLLFSKSFEDGEHTGLGIFAGCVKRFSFGKHNDINQPSAVEAGLKIPHMGWNRIRFLAQDVPVLKDISDGSHMYFLHSYYAWPEDSSIIAVETDYGISFPSLVWKDNIFAAQFHPEKSQANGLQLLRNFVALKC